MSNIISDTLPLEKCPALVLNADYRPLSYYPLSIWCWQDSIKSVFLDRVTIVSNYDRVIRSPNFYMKFFGILLSTCTLVTQIRQIIRKNKIKNG